MPIQAQALDDPVYRGYPRSQLLYNKKAATTLSQRLSAEGGGFEPPIRFWRIHAFQACLFNHSSITP